MLTQAQIKAAADAILEATPAGTRVIVFGSHARGTAHDHSDLDLLVIEPEPFGSGEGERTREQVEVKDGPACNQLDEIFRLRKAVELVFKDHVQPVDVFVLSKNRFDQTSEIPNTLAFEALNYGILHEKCA